jgi:hypothetical protein
MFCSTLAFGGVLGKVKPLRGLNHLLPSQIARRLLQLSNPDKTLDQAHSPVAPFCLFERLHSMMVGFRS